jgi:PAS domain-containing protein
LESFSIKYFDLCYGSLPFPVEVFDENGFVVYINSAFSKKWGYSLSELSGYSYVTDKELQKREIVQKIASVFQKKKPLQIQNYIDTRLLGSNNAAPFLRTTIFPIKPDDKTFVVLFHESQRHE